MSSSHPSTYPSFAKLKGDVFSASTISYIALCLSLSLASYLVYRYHYISPTISKEGWVEFFVAVVFLLAGFNGLRLFWSSKSKGNNIRLRIFYLVSGVAFILVAGEELSWGQHAIGYETPPFFQHHNQQGEANFHNIFNSVFPRLYALACSAFLLFCTWSMLSRTPKNMNLPGWPCLPLAIAGFALNLTNGPDVDEYIELIFALAVVMHLGRIFTTSILAPEDASRRS